MSAPTLSLSAPATGFVDEPVFIDAYPSTGVSNVLQSNGDQSFTMAYGDGMTSNLLRNGHAYRTAGTYTITVNGKNAAGEAGTQVTASITISAIPAATTLNTNDGAGQNIIDMTNAAGNASYYISPANYTNASANAVKLQAAIDHAKTINTVEQEIILPAGATFAGPIIMAVPTGSKYITIKTANLSSLAHDRRVVPGTDVANMPIITAPSSSDQTEQALRTPYTATDPPAHHYRIQGLHIKKDDDLSFSQHLVSFGPQSGLDAISKYVHHCILDRCWVDGGPQDNAYTKDGMRINGDYVSVVDSYFAEFKIIAGADATGVSIMTGQGPYAFWNNTIVAGAENFFLGGGGSVQSNGTVSSPTTTSATLSSVANLALDQDIAFVVAGAYGTIQSTIVRSINVGTLAITFDAIPTAPDNASTANWITTPSFIEFRRNYLFKPLKWFPRGGSWNGTTYQAKNLWETKNGRYMVMEGNVFRRSWITDQSYAIQFSVRNINGGYSPASVTREFQFSSNIVRDVAGVFGVAPCDSYITDGYPSQITQGITIRNNLIRNWGNGWDSASAVSLVQLSITSLCGSQKRIFYIHNTADNVANSINPLSSVDGNAPTGGAINSVWLNSLQRDGGYGIFDSYGHTQEQNLGYLIPPGNSTNTAGNRVVNTNGHTYPAWFQTGSGTWADEFVDYAAGDYTLTTGNPGHLAATDGTDVGVNMTALNAATLHTVDGDWSDAPPATVTICEWHTSPSCITA